MPRFSCVGVDMNHKYLSPDYNCGREPGSRGDSCFSLAIYKAMQLASFSYALVLSHTHQSYGRLIRTPMLFLCSTYKLDLRRLRGRLDDFHSVVSYHTPSAIREFFLSIFSHKHCSGFSRQKDLQPFSYGNILWIFCVWLLCSVLHTFLGILGSRQFSLAKVWSWFPSSFLRRRGLLAFAGDFYSLFLNDYGSDIDHKQPCSVLLFPGWLIYSYGHLTRLQA